VICRVLESESDRLANDLLVVSKDAFGALIPVGDDSVQIFCSYRIVRRLNYRARRMAAVSARLRSVMSNKQLTAPAILPCSSVRTVALE